MNQNEPIFLNLYIRDTESYRKITLTMTWKLSKLWVLKNVDFLERYYIFSTFIICT